MIYDDDPEAPARRHYAIRIGDRAAREPAEPPRNNADRELILAMAERWPDWPAERFHERLRRVDNHTGITVEAIRYVLAERAAG